MKETSSHDHMGVYRCDACPVMPQPAAVIYAVRAARAAPRAARARAECSPKYRTIHARRSRAPARGPSVVKQTRVPCRIFSLLGKLGGYFWGKGVSSLDLQSSWRRVYQSVPSSEAQSDVRRLDKTRGYLRAIFEVDTPNAFRQSGFFFQKPRCKTSIPWVY